MLSERWPDVSFHWSNGRVAGVDHLVRVVEWSLGPTVADVAEVVGDATVRFVRHYPTDVVERERSPGEQPRAVFARLATKPATELGAGDGSPIVMARRVDRVHRHVFDPPAVG